MEATRQGGMRLSGQSPLKVPGLPVVSIITVVYNGAALLPKTMESVFGQDWPNIEYILIDGGSGDGTADIIRLHESRVAYWISEPDKGIYHAMNKGLAAATGDYVWFMNCGDLIYSGTTLSQIFAPFQPNENAPVNRPSLPDILYGEAMIVDESYREVGLRRLRPPETLNWKSFRKGMVVCHQAILVKREIAEPFDVERYSHSADYDWVLNALVKADRRQKTLDIRQKTEDGRADDWGLDYGKPPQADQDGGARHPGPSPDGPMTTPRLQPGASTPTYNTHQILCAFLDGGHSKKNIGISLRERFDSMVRHYGLLPTVIRHIPIVFRFGWYYLLHRRF